MRNIKIIGPILIIFMLFWSCGSGGKETVGKVVKLSGKITVNDEVIKKGQTIRVKDVIKTERDKTSFIDIKFNNGHHLRLRNGELKIKEFGDKSFLNLFSGKLFTSAKKLLKNDSFEIETPTAVIGVRGTKFFTQEYPDKTYICVCEGKVQAYLKDNPKVKKEVPVGYDLYLEPDKKVKDPVESPDMVKMLVMEFDDMGLKVNK